MFTGLIEATGTVLSLQQGSGAARLTIAAPVMAGRLQEGDSIAVNGVCLTALHVERATGEHPGRFSADLAAETIERTTLLLLGAGALVNLELPTPSGAPLGGHVVQGHVDGVGTLISLVEIHPGHPATDWRMTLGLPQNLRPYVVSQGSITIDGISLTIAALTDTAAGPAVEVAIIPHTYAATRLHTLLGGAKVNVEVDVLGKYAERRMAAIDAADAADAADAIDAADAADAEHPGFALTAAYLVANGY
jgi:riboflavin synthase